MARVRGIGGVFLKSRDERKLREWYSTWLGIRMGAAGVTFKPTSMPRGAVTVLGIFPSSTRYFLPSRSAVMVNFVVDDIEAMLRRAAEGGGRVVGKIREYPYGRFAWFLDPDHNKVELWQPPAPKPRVRHSRERASRRTAR